MQRPKFKICFQLFTCCCRLGANSAYFGDSHPLSFSSMCFMYNVFPPPRDGPVSPEPRVWEEITATTGTGFMAVITHFSYAHTLIKKFILCVFGLLIWARGFAALSPLHRIRAHFHPQFKTPPTKREGNCRCGSYFLPGDPLLHIRFSRICAPRQPNFG